MNIRDLTYIRAVAKFGHFGQAAEACHVSQPALSTQIKKLELELGVALFERNNRTVRITSVGKDIIALADDILGLVDNIHSRAQSARDPLSGALTIGSIPTISPFLIPGFVNLSKTGLPNLMLEFTEDLTERLNDALLEGSLDVAVLATAPENPKLDTIELYDEPFWAVFSTRHDLRFQFEIKTTDLPKDDLLLLSEGHCFRDQMLDVCRMEPQTKSQVVRASSLETLINMVAAGHGVTLVPAMALRSGWMTDMGIMAVKLSDPTAYRRVYLTFRKTFPRRELLLKLADMICQDLGDSVRRL